MMKGLFAASRRLAPVVALTVAAALCTAAPASATASPASTDLIGTTASVGPASAGAQCNFMQSTNTCESTDPTIAYVTHAYGDTTNCGFIFDVAWGDGSSVTETVNNPPDGNHLLADHTYAAPKTYSISITVSVTAGNCTGTSSVHKFTLLLARHITLVPAGKVHMKGHTIFAYHVSGKTHYRGKVAVAVIDRDCALAIGKALILHEVAGLLFSLIPDGEVVVLILLSPADAWDIFSSCVPIQVKYHKK
jgi:hypothetical protein